MSQDHSDGQCIPSNRNFLEQGKMVEGDPGVPRAYQVFRGLRAGRSPRCQEASEVSGLEVGYLRRVGSPIEVNRLLGWAYLGA